MNNKTDKILERVYYLTLRYDLISLHCYDIKIMIALWHYGIEESYQKGTWGSGLGHMSFKDLKELSIFVYLPKRNFLSYLWNYFSVIPEYDIFIYNKYEILLKDNFPLHELCIKLYVFSPRINIVHKIRILSYAVQGSEFLNKLFTAQEINVLLIRKNFSQLRYTYHL